MFVSWGGYDPPNSVEEGRFLTKWLTAVLKDNPAPGSQNWPHSFAKASVLDTTACSSPDTYLGGQDFCCADNLTCHGVSVANYYARTCKGGQALVLWPHFETWECQASHRRSEVARVGENEEYFKRIKPCLGVMDFLSEGSLGLWLHHGMKTCVPCGRLLSVQIHTWH
jgi:hypothetical protein